MKYRIKITELGESWYLPRTYTEEEAKFEIELQEEMNRVNVILGEDPAKIEMIEIN